MAEMTAEYEEIQVPDGGVASFMMSDEDIAALEREEDQQLVDEAYGGEGISQFTDVASQMAALGRFGDDVIVHAQTGELVIPKNILDENPEIKEVVFRALVAQGIEDPEQYVVGSGAASINPETGLAEYGFRSFVRRVTRPITRTVSSVAKGVKKVASQAVKVLKKVAPIVLPIALSLAFPALGAYGAALGSGIGTLLQGGDIKDALKSAALSGLTSAAFTGFTGPGTFGENFTGALSNPGARFAQVGGQIKSGLSGQGFNFGQQFVPPATTPAQDTSVFGESIRSGDASTAYQTQPITASEQMASDLGTTTASGPKSLAEAGAAEGRLVGRQPPLDTSGATFSDANYIQPAQANVPGGGAPGAGAMDQSVRSADKSFLQSAKETIFGAPEKSVSDVLKDPAFIKEYGNLPTTDKIQLAKVFSDETQKTFLQKVAPYALAGGAYLYGTGGFETPPEEDPGILDRDAAGNVITGADLFAANPQDFMVDIGTAESTYFQPQTPYYSSYNAPLYQAPTQTAYYNPFELPSYGLQQSTPSSSSPFYRPPVQTAAKGGEIFPRRNGGIMPDEGVPGKDSVRAMLMPGEFVMTTDAVKGAGGGDLRRGINRMYDVMANLERKGRMA